MLADDPSAAVTAAAYLFSNQPDDVALPDPNEAIAQLHFSLEEIRTEMMNDRFVEDDPVQQILDKHRPLIRSLSQHRSGTPTDRH